MEHFSQLRTWEQDGYTIQVAYAPESCHPSDCFGDTEYVGGMLYSRVEEVFEDGVVDDMVYAATVAARERASVLKAQLERILATETV